MGRAKFVRALCAILLGALLVLVPAAPTWADDPPAGDPPAADDGFPVPDGGGDGDPNLGPAPDVRPRPPPPPPPGVAIPEWDLDHLNSNILPPPLPKPLPFDLRNIMFRHDERFASADGRITPLKRIPQWVDVIERHDLTEWRPKSIGFLSRRFPNVTTADAGNPFLEIPFIRGLGGDRVRILTDGVWSGTQALGSQGSTLSLWDPESTERVEIYHGPGAYLKAIDSPGGFINIVPRRARQHGKLSADFAGSVSYDSAVGRTRGRAEVDVGEGRIAALAGVTWSHTGHRDTGDGFIRPTQYDQLAADLAFDYFLAPNARLGITAQYMEASNIHSPINTGTVSQPSYDRLFLGISLSSINAGPIFGGTRLSLSVDSFFQDDDLLIQNQQAGIGNSDDVTRYDLTLQGELHLFCCHTTWAELTASYGRLERDETLLCVPAAPGPIPVFEDEPALRVGDEPNRPRADLSNCTPVTRTYEAEELFISALLTDTIHTGCYDFYTGLRADYIYIDDSRPGQGDQNEFLVSGVLGAAFHITQRTSLYGNLSYGSRRPTLFERGATEIVNGIAIFGNADLDPEIHGNAEVGIKQSFKNTSSLQASLFVHYIDETIAPTPLAGGNSALLENQDAVWLYGFEVAGAWRPCKTIEGLELFGTAGVTESSDQDLVKEMPLFARGGARYSVPSPRGYVVRRWFTELSFYGASDSRRNNTGGAMYVTGDFIVGGQVDFGCGNWVDVNLGVTNLLDAGYRPSHSFFDAPGLSVFAGLGFDI